MKNKLKKVIAYVLSFMMLFTMSAMNIGSVSAASTGSITVHTGKHDVNGVNFNAYRLMDATVSGNKVSYSISSNFTGFFTEELLNGTTGDDIDIKAYNYIKANVSTTDFQNKLKTYIETNKYGKYTKLNNLEIIIDSLDEKALMPSMQRLINLIKENFEYIKERLISNKNTGISDYINDVIQTV